MKSVTLSARDLKSINSMTSRHQVVTFIFLLSLLELDKDVVSDYTDLAWEELGLSDRTLNQVLGMLVWDGHIEKVGGVNAKFGDCPLKIASRSENSSK